MPWHLAATVVVVVVAAELELVLLFGGQGVVAIPLTQHHGGRRLGGHGCEGRAQSRGRGQQELGPQQGTGVEQRVVQKGKICKGECYKKGLRWILKGKVSFVFQILELMLILILLY